MTKRKERTTGPRPHFFLLISLLCGHHKERCLTGKKRCPHEEDNKKERCWARVSSAWRHMFLSFWSNRLVNWWWKGNGDWIRKKHAAGGWQAVTFSFLMSSPAHRLIHDMKENANVSRMTSTKEKVGLPKKSCRANRRAADQRPRRRCPTVDKDFFVTPLIKLDDQSRKAP